MGGPGRRVGEGPLPRKMARPKPPLPFNSTQAREGGEAPRGKGVRSWMSISEFGELNILEGDKHAIMRRIGIPARDLRVVDPLLAYPSAILDRETSIIINVENARLFITAQEVILPYCDNPDVLALIEELRGSLAMRRWSLVTGLPPGLSLVPAGHPGPLPAAGPAGNIWQLGTGADARGGGFGGWGGGASVGGASGADQRPDGRPLDGLGPDHQASDGIGPGGELLGAGGEPLDGAGPGSELLDGIGPDRPQLLRGVSKVKQASGGAVAEAFPEYAGMAGNGGDLLLGQPNDPSDGALNGGLVEDDMGLEQPDEPLLLKRGRMSEKRGGFLDLESGLGMGRREGSLDEERDARLVKMRGAAASPDYKSSPEPERAHANALPSIIPLELQVLEVVLKRVCGNLQGLAAGLEKRANPVVDGLMLKVTKGRLGQAQEIKGALLELLMRTSRVRYEVESILDDDDTLANICLTAKLLKGASTASSPSTIPLLSLRKSAHSPSRLGRQTVPVSPRSHARATPPVWNPQVERATPPHHFPLDRSREAAHRGAMDRREATVRGGVAYPNGGTYHSPKADVALRVRRGRSYSPLPHREVERQAGRPISPNEVARRPGSPLSNREARQQEERDWLRGASPRGERDGSMRARASSFSPVRRSVHHRHGETGLDMPSKIPRSRSFTWLPGSSTRHSERLRTGRPEGREQGQNRGQGASPRRGEGGSSGGREGLSPQTRQEDPLKGPGSLDLSHHHGSDSLHGDTKHHRHHRRHHRQQRPQPDPEHQQNSNSCQRTQPEPDLNQHLDPERNLLHPAPTIATASPETTVPATPVTDSAGSTPAIGRHPPASLKAPTPSSEPPPAIMSKGVGVRDGIGAGGGVEFGAGVGGGAPHLGVSWMDQSVLAEGRDGVEDPRDDVAEARDGGAETAGERGSSERRGSELSRVAGEVGDTRRGTERDTGPDTVGQGHMAVDPTTRGSAPRARAGDDLPDGFSNEGMGPDLMASQGSVRSHMVSRMGSGSPGRWSPGAAPAGKAQGMLGGGGRRKRRGGGGGGSMAGGKGSHRSSRSSSLVSSHVKTAGILAEHMEDFEMLLEAYNEELGGITNRLSAVRDYIDDTEDYINIRLDEHQNQLLNLEVVISVGVMAAGFCTVSGGYAGMNIACKYFTNQPPPEDRPDTPDIWDIWTFSTVATSVLLGALLCMWLRWNRLFMN